MIGRLISFLIALAVAGAPVSFEACSIACASSGHDHATHAPSCHDAAPHARLLPHPHACDHSGDLPTTPSLAATRDTHNAIDLTSVLPACAAQTLVPMANAGHTAGSCRHPEQLHARLAIPLRI